METFELKAAINFSVNCMNRLESSRKVTVHPIGPEIHSHLISDMHWLSENLLCLLSNAIKYSDDGSVDVEIKLVDNHDIISTKMVLVKVKDTGIGISVNARKDLFQPFKQAQRHAGGTGLGNSTCFVFSFLLLSF